MNDFSDGNNRSSGNNRSDGNNCSSGNNRSNGNNCSNGNNYSNGNNWSIFMFNCKGTHKSILCKDQRGISYMVLNQQLSKDNSLDFYTRLLNIIGYWLPYTIDYKEKKDKGWHTSHKNDNEYVSEIVKDFEEPYTKQYHHAWSSCPFKKEIIQLIKDVDYLDTEPALKVFEEITGVNSNESDNVKITCEGKTVEISRESAKALNLI